MNDKKGNTTLATRIMSAMEVLTSLVNEKFSDEGVTHESLQANNACVDMRLISNELYAKDIKSVLRKYLINENSNFHIENLLLLATHFGTQEEVDVCRSRVDSMGMDARYDARYDERYQIPKDVQRKINRYYYVYLKQLSAEQLKSMGV